MLVLIADDHADAREALRILLELEGHTVVEAANGLEAVEIAFSTRPDVILMDLNMPVMDGLTAIGKLRADASTLDIRIIVVSASVNDPQAKQRLTECGCQSCFMKPVEFQSLRQAMYQAAA